MTRPIGTRTKKMKISPITDFVFCEMGPLQKRGSSHGALALSIPNTFLWDAGTDEHHDAWPSFSRCSKP
jgi:hypothetical protein